MYEWLVQFFTNTDLVVFGTGMGLIVGGAAAAYRGMQKGRPTTGAVAEAIVASSCMAPGIEREVGKLRGEVAEMHRSNQHANRKIDDIENLLIRVEERTRRIR